MGQVETMAYNPSKLEKNNWGVDIFEDIPLDYACEIGLNHAQQQGLDLDVRIGNRGGSDNINWETDPEGPQGDYYFVLTDTISEPLFTGLGKRVLVKAGSYMLLLPYDLQSPEQARLEIYPEKLDSKTLERVKQKLNSQGAKVRIAR